MKCFTGAYVSNLDCGLDVYINLRTKTTARNNRKYSTKYKENNAQKGNRENECIKQTSGRFEVQRKSWIILLLVLLSYSSSRSSQMVVVIHN